MPGTSNRPAEFWRPVYCVLGIPIDAVTRSQALGKIRQSIVEGKRFIYSTPNLSFITESQKNKRFRLSLLQSDLCVVDGMPLVWVSRILGIPIRERVAGSTLFDSMARGDVGAATVYFFGGGEAIAVRACERLNSSSSALRCVGYENPGFGSVGDLSTDESIAKINACQPDCLFISLGLTKGQDWIFKNAARHSTPIITYAGAIVNFVAGSVQRAPERLQRLGLEWLWRIKEEPLLWRRYLLDGVWFIYLMFFRVLPSVIYQRVLAGKENGITAAHLAVGRESNSFTIVLSGSWVDGNIDQLRRAFARAAELEKDIILDLAGVVYVDPAVLGLLMVVLAYQMRQRRGFRIISVTKKVATLFRLNCCEFLFSEDWTDIR